MKKCVTAMLMALYLLAGCSSSGEGTSGAGSTFAVQIGNLLVTGSVTADGSISVDTIQDVCEPADPATMTEAELEPGLTTTLGTFVITVTDADVAGLTSDFIAEGVVFNSYTVSYVAEADAGAPGLAPRTHSQTVSLIGTSGTITETVILVDLGFTIPEFQSKNPGGTVFSYRVTVTWNGTSLSGQAIQLASSTFLELGNFDRCAGAAT